MDTQHLQTLFQAGIAGGAAPGAVFALILPSGGHCWCAGRSDVQAGFDIATDDVFDLASLSKVVCTTTLVLQLLGDERLTLDTPLTEVLTDFAALSADPQHWRQEVTTRHLLTHSAGLPPFLPFWKTQAQLTEPADQRRLIRSTALITRPGTVTVYSDIGFLVLAQVVENLMQEHLDKSARHALFTPLGMTRTGFCPHAWTTPPRCVPTEEIAGHPGQYWTGIVHDENARWLGGVAGHAGLFAAAPDLARFAGHLVELELPGIPPALLSTALQPAGRPAGSTRGLGWDTRPQTPGLFFHSGFTGTAIWGNPVKHYAAVLLSNAVHPHRECKTRGFFPWREALIAATEAGV